MDWNLDFTDQRNLAVLAGEDVLGWHMFYYSKDLAQQLGQISEDPDQGFYNSLPVTRYRQRSVFIRRTDWNEMFLQNRQGLPIKEKVTQFLIETKSGRKPFIITDILGQARAVGRTVSNSRLPEIVYPETLLGGPHSNDEAAVFVYSGPSTAYMTQRTDDFIPINIDDLPTLRDEAYETHIIWHVPPRAKTGDNLTVKRCLSDYHMGLFEAARSQTEASFDGVGDAIRLTLAARHPAFGSEVFRHPAEIKQCLLEHHSDPPHL
jgi:hypothetical protein